MELVSRSTIGGMGLFLGVVAPKIDDLSVVRNLRLPAPLAFGNPRKAANPFQAVTIRGFTVRSVLPVGRLSQIADAIVAAISVDVVQHRRRERPVDVQPRKSMLGIGRAVDFYVSVASSLLRVPSSLADADLRTRRNPMELPGIRGVRQDGREVIFFHATILPDWQKEGKD